MSAKDDGNTRLPSQALSGNMGRAIATIGVDAPAIALFDYFLVNILGVESINDMDPERLNEDVQNILTGYSLYLCDTNIPRYFQRYLADPNPDKKPSGYMDYTSLGEYLGKAKNLLQKLTPDNEFWRNEEAVNDITGASFKRACRRSQQSKDDSFGQESKIGLYRVARHGETVQGTPHWINLVNCTDICKRMLKETTINDTTNKMLPEKRLVLVATKHAVGRGGEARFLDVNNFQYDICLDALNTLWREQKTLRTYGCPFVPNKEGYATDMYHALGTFFVCGRGLYRAPTPGGKLDTHLIPHLNRMSGSNAAGWLTTAIRQYLPEEVPKLERKSVSSVSLRMGSITEMGIGNVGFYPSHARSGHSVGTNQQKYFDRDAIELSITAAKCLAGWTDFNAAVSLPNLRCLNVPDEVINNLVDNYLVVNVFDEFSSNGRLRPVLLACVASLIMYDREVVNDLGLNNAVSKALRDAFKKAKITDRRATDPGSPVAALELWGSIIRSNFETNNPDFHPLTNASNSAQVADTLNQTNARVVALHRDHQELHRSVTHLTTVVEEEREARKQMTAMLMEEREAKAAERRENIELRKSVAELTNLNCQLMGKLTRMGDWMRVPPSPMRQPLAFTSSSASSPVVESRKRPPEPEGVLSSPVSGVRETASSSSLVPAMASSGAPPPALPAPAAVASDALAPSLAISAPAPAARANNAVPSESASAPPLPPQEKATLVTNFNDADAFEDHGGTRLQDIVIGAHASGYFTKETASFKGIRKPHRFEHDAKFKHCLDLFDAVTTPEQWQMLRNPELHQKELADVAYAITEQSMVRLDNLEGTPRGRKKPQYSGIGGRVSALKTKYNWSSIKEAGTVKPRTMDDYPKQDRPVTHRIGPSTGSQHKKRKKAANPYAKKK